MIILQNLDPVATHPADHWPPDGFSITGGVDIGQVVQVTTQRVVAGPLFEGVGVLGCRVGFRCMRDVYRLQFHLLRGGGRGRQQAGDKQRLGLNIHRQYPDAGARRHPGVTGLLFVVVIVRLTSPDDCDEVGSRARRHEQVR